jgi:putative aldouronate transport system permease protein
MVNQRNTTFDKWVDRVNYGLLILITIIVVYPLLLVVVSSISDPDAVNNGSVWLYPIGFTLEGYQAIFADPTIWRGYANSLLYMALGTVLSIIITIPAGYAMSRTDLKGRNVFMFFIAFTMFFGGGLIPSYLLIKGLGMNNTIWALIIPGAVSAYNLIIVRTFFQSTIPKELLEASQMDGCSDFRFFGSIVLPLSVPIIAVITLFTAVGHWNSYFQALIYIRDEALYPLQLVLRNILIVNETQNQMLESMQDMTKVERLNNLMKYGVIVVASIPMLILYPFLQRYFVKGIMIGSIKG